MIFSKGPPAKNVFYDHNEVIKTVKEFKCFSQSGYFFQGKKNNLCEQAQKATV